MKKFNHQQNWTHILGIALSFAVSMPLLAAAEADSKQINASAKTNQAAIEIPRSVFTIPVKAADGRDPFFPLSRRMVVETKPGKIGETPTPPPVAVSLKGISRGAGNKRFALINDKTFTVDDEHEVVMNNSRVRIHCIEIKEDSVIVEVNGVRQELRMRPGL